MNECKETKKHCQVFNMKRDKLWDRSNRKDKTIKDNRDKQSLFSYLKELENDYIVSVKKQRNIVAICRTVTIGNVSYKD